jgi:hypothetical protein
MRRVSWFVIAVTIALAIFNNAHAQSFDGKWDALFACGQHALKPDPVYHRQSAGDSGIIFLKRRRFSG